MKIDCFLNFVERSAFISFKTHEYLSQILWQNTKLGIKMPTIATKENCFVFPPLCLACDILWTSVVNINLFEDIKYPMFICYNLPSFSPTQPTHSSVCMFSNRIQTVHPVTNPLSSPHICSFSHPHKNVSTHLLTIIRIRVCLCV